MGFLFLYLLDFNYDLKLNQVARRQTSPPEILLEMIVICLCHLHINCRVDIVLYWWWAPSATSTIVKSAPFLCIK